MTIRLLIDFSTEFLQAKEDGTIYLKCWGGKKKKKTWQQNYCIWLTYHSKMKYKYELSQTKKKLGVHHHNLSLRNVKGCPLSWKERMLNSNKKYMNI